MIYTPNPKALVYSELFFISSVATRQAPVVSMDAIIDEVSREIFDLFIAEDASHHQFNGVPCASEIRN